MLPYSESHRDVLNGFLKILNQWLGSYSAIESSINSSEDLTFVILIGCLFLVKGSKSEGMRVEARHTFVIFQDEEFFFKFEECGNIELKRTYNLSTESL